MIAILKKNLAIKANYKKNILLKTLLATTSLSLLASAAYADEDKKTKIANDASVSASNDLATGNDLVIVTARKRQESAQKVPIAITTLGAKQIESAGAYRLDQIKQLAPSVQTISFNPRNANVSIRGLGANVSLTNDGLEQGVGFYLDDVYYGRPGQSQYDLVDISQIEILRGPQGTLFGKNTTAGAISVTTKKPSFTPEANLEVSGGNLGFQQGKVSVTGPLLGDWLAGRLTVSGTRRDGYIHNVRTDRDLHDYENFTARAQFLVAPHDNWEDRLIIDYGLQRQECCIAVIAGVATTRIDGTPLPNNFATRIARIGYTPLVGYDASQRETDIDGTARTNMYQWGVANTFEYNFKDFVFTSISSYRRWFWTPSNDADNIGAPVLYQARIIDHQKQASQEFRIASKGDNKVDWVAGAYYFWQGLDGFSTTWFGPDGALFNLAPALWTSPATFQAATGIVAPNVTPALAKAALDGYRTDYYSRAETNSYALYGQSTWHLNEKVDLTGGLRYTKEVKDGTFNQIETGGTALSSFSATDRPYVAALRNLVGGVASYTSHIDESNVSGLFTATYNISNDAILYATYSRGYKSGGLNLTKLPAVATKTLEPEQVDNVEFGLKSSWFNRNLIANLAIYDTKISNYQTNVFDLANFVQYIANAGTVRATGFEADLKFSPNGSFSSYTSVAFNDARYESYPNAPAPVEYTGIAQFVDLSGKPLPGAPKWSLSLGGEYRFKIPSVNNWQGYVGLDVNSKTKYFASVNDSIYSVINGYTTANARFGIRNENGSDISLWVKNLTDEVYFETYGAGNAGASGLITGLVSQPRTYGLTFRTRFGS